MYAAFVVLGLVAGGLLWLFWPAIYNHYINKRYEELQTTSIDWEFCLDPSEDLDCRIDEQGDLHVDLTSELTIWDDDLEERWGSNKSGWLAMSRWRTLVRVAVGFFGLGTGGILHLHIFQRQSLSPRWAIGASVLFAALWGVSAGILFGYRLVCWLMKREPEAGELAPESEALSTDEAPLELRLRAKEDIGWFAVDHAGLEVTVSSAIRGSTVGRVRRHQGETDDGEVLPDICVPARVYDPDDSIESGEAAFVVGYHHGAVLVVGRNFLLSRLGGGTW